MAEEIEKIYVIPLRKNSGFKSSNAAPAAIKRVKTFLTRHMKVEEDKIWIDDSLNNAIWSKGKYNMPSKIRVKATKFEDGVVEAYLPELEFKKSRRELLKEEKEKKEPILIKEEAEAAEGEAGETPGAEDYEVTPTADGEVKIKKKKPAKKKTEKKPKEKKPTEKKEKPADEEKKQKKTTEKKESKPAKKKASSKSKGKSKTTTSKKKTEKKSG